MGHEPQTSHIPEQLVTGANAAAHDCSKRIKGFGALLIVVGAANLLTIPLHLMLPSAAAGGSPRVMLAADVLIYAALGAVFIWCGIGSLRLRRWARPVVLLISWGWLLSGGIGLAILILLMPGLLSGLGFALPGAPTMIAVGAVLFACALGMVTLPGIITWFYSLAAVKQTLEQQDPRPSWTEACPLPVLALSLAMGLSAVLCLPAAFNGQLPLFGKNVTGFPAALLILANGCACAYVAAGLYRMRIAALWATLLLTVIWSAWSAFSLDSAVFETIIRDTGYGGLFATASQNIDGPIKWTTILLGILASAAVLYCAKYFRKTKSNLREP
jgi:hypothetical protein